MYTLHTTAGDIELKAKNVKELRLELERRLADGEFENEAAKRRWMPVISPGNYLVCRVDLRDERKWGVQGLGERDIGSELPPYVIHTTGGDVATAAWSVHEFRMELECKLEAGEIPRFVDAPNEGRSRTVTQGRLRVGLVDWETGEFTPTAEREKVAYSVRHGNGRWFPTEAKDLDALRAELTMLTQSGAFLQTGEGEYWLEVEGPQGAVERRVARLSSRYREEAVAVPYEVHRAQWSCVAGERSHQSPLKCAAKETGELRIELGTLLHEGEFQNEEDCRIRWLPVTQGDWLVGYVDAAERLFVPKTKRRIRYRIGSGWGSGVAMAADAVEGLRSELKARKDDLRYLVDDRGDAVFCEGRFIGRVAGGGRLLLHDTWSGGTDEEGPDGASCKSCRYWRFRNEFAIDTEETESIASEGECRRWSPHPRHRWPVTRGSGWCGEHRSGPESG